jgi:hypothetical protein
MKPTELQLTYKKVISFTEQQKKSLKKLEQYDVNVNEFIRIAIREKLAREWKGIKESKDNYCPF